MDSGDLNDLHQIHQLMAEAKEPAPQPQEASKAQSHWKRTAGESFEYSEPKASSKRLKEVQASVEKAAAELADKDGRIYIPDLRKKLGAEVGGRELDDALRQMRQSDRARVIAIGDKSRHTPEQQGQMMPGENELFGYVEMQEAPKAPAAEAKAPKPAKQPKAKAEKPTPAPKNEHGQPGAGHPLAGQTKDQQVASLSKIVGRIEDGEADPFKVTGGPPTGLDMKSFEDNLIGAIARHQAVMGVRAPIDDLYASVGKHHGLSKHDFLKAVQTLKDADKFQGGGGWPNTLDNLPDPELVRNDGTRLIWNYSVPQQYTHEIEQEARRGDKSLNTTRGASHPEATKPAEVKAHSPADVRKALPDAAAAVKAASGPAGVVRIPELHDELVKRFPNLSREQFHGILQDMAKNDEAVLQVSNDPRLEPRAAEGIDSPRGKLFTVKLRKGG